MYYIHYRKIKKGINSKGRVFNQYINKDNLKTIRKEIEKDASENGYIITEFRFGYVK